MPELVIPLHMPEVHVTSTDALRTDGMGWWNGISANQNCQNSHHGRGEVVSPVSPLLTWTGLVFLASVFYPRSQAHTWAHGQGDVLAVWMSGDVCVNWNEPKACHAQLWTRIRMKLGTCNYWWVRAGGYDLSLPWFWESNRGMILKGQLALSASHLKWSSQIKCELTNYT